MLPDVPVALRLSFLFPVSYSLFSQAGISNTLEVYQGDHGSHVAQRIPERLLPWISNQISK